MLPAPPLLVSLLASFASDDYTGLTSGVTAAAVILIVTLGRLQARKKRILITDYRRGVRFVSGAVAGVLGPGTHRYDTRKEQISIVDMRPQPVLVERLVFQDAVNTPALISIASEMRVQDPQLASTALRDQVKDGYAILRDTLRMFVSQQILQPGAESRDALAKALNAAIDTALRKVGMTSSDLEITELWVGMPPVTAATPSGVVQ